MGKTRGFKDNRQTEMGAKSRKIFFGKLFPP
jgi:hypothetical protein